MKQALLHCVICSFLGNAFAQTTYDVFTYTEPKGYKKEKVSDNILLILKPMQKQVHIAL